MRLLSRNCRTIYYCLYSGKTMLTDSNGNETGEYKITYATEVAMEANVSPATGRAAVEMFGNLEGYDKVILTDDVSCPIDVNTVLFVDKSPQYDQVSGAPIYDYVVKRVAKSLNSVAIAVRKVAVQ